MKTIDAVAALAALAQETRLAVFRLLVEQGETGLAAGEIAERVGAAPAALSFHLKELAHARLVRSRQEGRYVFYSADFTSMNRLLAFLTENCCAVDGGTCGPVACVPSSSTRATSRKARA